MRVAQVRVLGGAMARVASDATAFAHRNSRILATVAAFYDGVEDLNWSARRGSPSSRRPWSREMGAYVGFLGDEGEARVRAAYPGSTWERLARSARHDPANVFRLNHNIKIAKVAQVPHDV